MISDECEIFQTRQKQEVTLRPGDESVVSMRLPLPPEALRVAGKEKKKREEAKIKKEALTGSKT